MLRVTCDPSRLTQSCSDNAMLRLSLWDSISLCTILHVLCSSSAHSAGRSSDWMHLRALLHVKCYQIVGNCMISANKLGASAAANAIWMLMNICEYALIPVCGSDTCLCGTADKRLIAKKRAGDVEAAPLLPSSVEIAVSSKYTQEPIPCPYCCIKKITNAVTHICASVSSISRPTTIPVPSRSDAVLDDDDEYLSVRDSFRRVLVRHIANALFRFQSG
jgi:hypothetical protein